MEFVEAFSLQLAHLLDEHCGRNQLAAFRSVIETLIKGVEPCGNTRAAALCHPGDTAKIRRGHQTRHDRNIDTRSLRAVAEPRIDRGFERELRDGATRPCIDLRFKHVEIPDR